MKKNDTEKKQGDAEQRKLVRFKWLAKHRDSLSLMLPALITLAMIVALIGKQYIKTSVYVPAAASENQAASIAEILEKGMLITEKGDISIYFLESIVYFAAAEGADTTLQFLLRTYPADVSTLSADRQSKGFDKFDFMFDNKLSFTDTNTGKRVAAVPLNLAYETAYIEAGQYDANGNVFWKVKTDLSGAAVEPDSDSSNAAAVDPAALFAEITNTGIPLAEKDGISVYLKDGTVYFAASEGAETTLQFLLRVYPADISVLPADRQSKGFDKFDFMFDNKLSFTDPGTGKRVAAVPLNLAYKPAYVEVGQYDAGGSVSWKVKTAVSSAAAGADAASSKAAAVDHAILFAEIINTGILLAEKEALSVYLKDGTIYFAASESTDTTLQFLLRVYPADISVLPADRQSKGFDKFDFMFDDKISFTDPGTGKRVAEVPLNFAYDPVYFEVGQYDTSGSVIWKIKTDLSGAKPVPDTASSDAVIANSTILFDEITNTGLLLAENSAVKVYLVGNSVYFAAENGSDTTLEFLLRAYPADASVLSEDRRSKGFDKLDFMFDDKFFFTDPGTGVRVATVTLVLEYDPAFLEAGQYDSNGSVRWKIKTDVTDTWYDMDQGGEVK